MREDGILNDVPVIRYQDVLRALIEYGVETIVCHVERHAVSAGLQAHLGKIFEIVDICRNPPARRRVFQLPDHVVHLIHSPLPKVVLLAQLIAVSLSDRIIFSCPGIPDMTLKL